MSLTRFFADLRMSNNFLANLALLLMSRASSLIWKFLLEKKRNSAPAYQIKLLIGNQSASFDEYQIGFSSIFSNLKSRDL